MLAPDSILYHSTHKELEPGSIVEPGNWGTKILEIGPSHNWWNSEQILERVRLESYPEKPSRFHSTFACESLDTAICYRSKSGPSNIIYSVMITNISLPWHRGDFNATKTLPRHANMETIAELYWRYGLKTAIEEWRGVICSEIVTLSSLKVLFAHEV